MQVAIVGYATDGRISADYFARRGDQVTVCDHDETISVPDAYHRQLGGTYLENMDRFDLIIRSSGIRPDVILRDNPKVGGKITTSIDEFLRACPTKHVIGVTGTKGKGTTSTLIANILTSDGKHTELGGNIGTPPLSFIDTLTEDSWVVLELSSFQLFDIRRSPHIALCLMVVPEHLDWHADIAEYTGAKARLFEWQNSDDVAIYFAENELSKEIAHAGAGRKVPYYSSPGAWLNGNMITIDGQEICTADELKLLGKHNWQNVCAAITAVWQTGMHDIAAIRDVLTTFTGLPHRIEFVREIGGARYYDDSFGTTPETAIVALQAFASPKVIILGGSDKGASYDKLAQAVSNSEVRAAILIGNQAERIKRALTAVGYQDIIEGCADMPEIVTTAQAVAKPGDIVLLSTGCASFDMFQNYKDRGDQFKTAVQALAAVA